MMKSIKSWNRFAFEKILRVYCMLALFTTLPVIGIDAVIIAAIKTGALIPYDQPAGWIWVVALSGFGLIFPICWASISVLDEDKKLKLEYESYRQELKREFDKERQYELAKLKAAAPRYIGFPPTGIWKLDDQQDAGVDRTY